MRIFKVKLIFLRIKLLHLMSIVCILFISISYSQEFLITSDGGDNPLVSQYSGKVYYYTNFTNEVRVLSNDLKSSKLTSISSLPSSHQDSPYALYQVSPFMQNSGYVYTYNEVSEESSFLFNAQEDSFISNTRILKISPGGNRVLINDRRPDYFNMADSNLINVEIPMDMRTEPLIWGENDSIIYYLKAINENLLLEGNIITGKIDTILNLIPYGSIKAIDFNTQRDLIAISYSDTTNVDKLDLLSVQNGERTNIYDPIQTPDIYDGGLINSVRFSPDNNQLVFFEFRIESTVGGLYLYDINAANLIKLSELPNLHNIVWYNNDTLIYSRGYAEGLYGFSLDIPDPILEDKFNNDNNDNKFDAYPNPFNSYINFAFYLDVNSNLELNIYDILGSIVATVYKGKLAPGKQNINWEFKKSIPESLSSSVYIAQLKYITDKKTIIHYRKIIYLK